MTSLPDKIGPYQILRKLGEGGMGAVYEGLHTLIERRVAIKVLHPAFAMQPEFTARFFNEARAVNRVDHPGVVQISDYGQLPDSTAYIVMEFLAGESLADRLEARGGPLPLEQALNIGAQISDVLTAAHEKSVIHRDLKPDNVMMVADNKAPGGERTKLLDFGIAKLADDGPPGKGPGKVKTSTNSFMGTPYYMSPEQCKGAGKVDGRSDVYSLGVMMYEMLCGERPIVGEGQGDIIVKHLTEEPAPLKSRVPELPESVHALVHRMLSKDRDKRPVMRDVSIELETLSEQFPPRSTRRTTANVPIVTPPIPAERPATGVGTAAGQTTPPRVRGRSLILAVVGAVALLGFSALGVRTLRQKPAVIPPPVAVPAAKRVADPPPAVAPPVETPPSVAPATAANKPAKKSIASSGTPKKGKSGSRSRIKKGSRQIED